MPPEGALDDSVTAPGDEPVDPEQGHRAEDRGDHSRSHIARMIEAERTSDERGYIAPAIPTSAVTMTPPGSFPGMSSLAMAPTTRLPQGDNRAEAIA